MFCDEIWEAIFDQLVANFQKIDESLASEKYGMAAHYDSKNVALIELLEHDYNSSNAAKFKTSKAKKLAKATTTKGRFDALKKVCCGGKKDCCNG